MRQGKTRTFFASRRKKNPGFSRISYRQSFSENASFALRVFTRFVRLSLCAPIALPRALSRITLASSLACALRLASLALPNLVICTPSVRCPLSIIPAHALLRKYAPVRLCGRAVRCYAYGQAVMRHKASRCVLRIWASRHSVCSHKASRQTLAVPYIKKYPVCERQLTQTGYSVIGVGGEPFDLPPSQSVRAV